MAEEPFWPSEKYSSASSTSVRCRWRISVASRSTDAPRTPSMAKYMAWRSRGITWVEIGSTASPMALATWASTRGSTCAKVPTAPEIEAVATSLRAAAGKFRIGAGELEPERRGLGVDAVGAADRGRELVLERAALERLEQGIRVGDQEIGGAHELDVEAGIEHVGGSQPLMHEAGIRADDLGEMRQERDDVVLDFALDRIDALEVEAGIAPLVPDDLGCGLRDQPELGHGVGGMRLDLEPDAEPGLGRPDLGHLRPGVARDHRRAFHAASPRAINAALRIAAMLAR